MKLSLFIKWLMGTGFLHPHYSSTFILPGLLRHRLPLNILYTISQPHIAVDPVYYMLPYISTPP
ncbi:MAG: hypothetical protein ORN57_00180, partial [Alphaproteobacteria bacterium]|nr:hypothetical protein [Alphaproteobacteria bacterium]